MTLQEGIYHFSLMPINNRKSNQLLNKGKATQSSDVEILTKEIISKGRNVVLQQLLPKDHIEASLSLIDQKAPFNSPRRQSCPSLDQQRTLVINGYKDHNQKLTLLTLPLQPLQRVLKFKPCQTSPMQLVNPKIMCPLLLDA